MNQAGKGTHRQGRIRTDPLALRRRGATTRSTATALALLLALGLIGAGLYLAVQPAGPAGPSANQPEPPREIAELLAPGAESGRGMTIQIADKDDPTRLAAEVLAERYDPDGPMHRRVEMPRAWLFGEDGSTWYIEADRGRFYIPEGVETPQEGYLEGNVRARRYEPTGGERPEPGVTPPSLTATTDEPLRFNLELMHFETDGQLRIRGEQIEFTGHGAYVVLDEKRERINALRIDRGERIVYTPVPPAATGGQEPADPPSSAAEPTVAGPASGAPSPTPAQERDALAQSAPADAAPAGALPAAPPAAADPKIDLYQIVFEDNVEVQTGSRRITSDLLTVWARLIDNKIPKRSSIADRQRPFRAGGFTEVLSALAVALPTDPDRFEVSTLDDRGASIGAPPAGDPQPAEPAQPESASPPEPVVLTWSGPLEIAPLTHEPDALLGGDDTAFRFDAEEGPVRFEDTADGARGRALSVVYFAGRERIELSGPGGQVELAAPGSGQIRNTSKMTVELGSGHVSVPAPGEMLGADHDETPGEATPQRVRWTGGAQFVFAVEDGRMTGRLERASFMGEVLGENRDATLAGSRLDALFDAPGEDKPRLVQLNVEDARASDGRGGTAAGEMLEVHFAPGTHGEEIDPVRVIITGSALVRREGAETIRAGVIDAGLGRDGEGNVIVTVADAEHAVEFDDGAGVSGRGQTLSADALAEHVVITGDNAMVRRDTTVITGPSIDLRGLERSVTVEGRGTFAHSGVDAEGADLRVIEAGWTDRMTFDDPGGLLECVGGVTAETVGPDRTRDNVEADRVVMTLDPLEPADPSDPNPGAETPGFDQRLQQAVAYGTPESPAIIESRRVDPDSPDDSPRVDEIFRLEGAQIRFAARDDRLEIPGPGRLFVLDRRADRPADHDASTDAMLAPGGRQGTSLFTWAGSMSFDRRLGLARFEQNVWVRNKPLNQPGVTDLTTDRLVARFATGEPPPADDAATPAGSFDGELLWAEAVGNAVLRMDGRREITADRLLYNAEAGEVLAAGDPGRRVFVQDLIRGTTSNFSSMRWDLREDVIEFIDPGSVVAPE